MTLKQYRGAKLAIVMILAAVFGQSIVRENFFLPIALLAAGVLIMFFLRQRVGKNEIIADERDYQVGGKAALLAIQIYSWIAVVSMFAFYSQKSVDPIFEAMGMVLAFSTTILLLLYALIFRYYHKFKFTDKSFLYTLAVLTLFIVLAVVGLRLFSGPEDTWICDNGQWVRHGHPDAPMPVTECGEKGEAENVAWLDIKAAVENCEVKSVMQTHSQEVTAVLKDGRELQAVEDNIDDIFAVVLKNKDKCGDIVMSTE
ncbi:MAG: DUF2178 domain-containing protein [Patescibacteria group bacterium]|jgi:uncharacterized membrane protein